MKGKKTQPLSREIGDRVPDFLMRWLGKQPRAKVTAGVSSELLALVYFRILGPRSVPFLPRDTTPQRGVIRCSLVSAGSEPAPAGPL